MPNLSKRYFKLGKIYNISATHSFADVLAEKLLHDYETDILGLPDVLILLPNRRACKTLAEAFVRHKGMQPTLLPQMAPLGDVEEDELVLRGETAGEEFFSVAPAIENSERLMLFMKIIMSRPQDFGIGPMPPEQACYLAAELGRLIDTANNERLDFTLLQDLVPEEYAAHWQETLKFLKIITEYWPDILKERGVTDASFRRGELMLLQSRIWQNNPPAARVIAAGTTATFPAMKELVKTVAGLPCGEVVLAGLDKCLDEEAWAAVDETHPQFELKSLLDFLGKSRNDAEDLIPAANPWREKLLSEVMRPAKTTDKWRGLPQAEGTEAVKGIQTLNCRDIREEALAIASVMRETLEMPEKTAALVTPDRNLARRVAAELERWNIKVDDSAGRPLVSTPWGVFMRLVLRAARPEATRTDVLSLLKHPLTGLGRDYGDVRRRARELECKVWRAGMTDEAIEQIMRELQNATEHLQQLAAQKRAGLKDLLTAHLETAETIAATADKDGASLLWRGDDGNAGAVFAADWLACADVLGEIDPAGYPGLFEAMLNGIMVRPKFGTHPRLKILGPIEARLNHFDVMIIGEVNEGVWPPAAASDPWMSRPMKRDFGFPQPEKSTGVLGLDFCQLLGAEKVFLTRAERVQGTPMIKSRWWMRLETVLKAMGIAPERLEAHFYRQAAAKADQPQAFEKAGAPAPRPPVSARPRELSVSAFEMLLRDPYSIFARYILHLKPLEEIEPDLTMADYGTIIHKILEDFNNKYPHDCPPQAEEELLALGRESFAQNKVAEDKKAFWWPKFEKMVKHLVELEKNYRKDIKTIHNEVRGYYEFAAPAGVFRITAKADRIDETKDGRLNIIDYKTGRARSVKEMSKGFAPQLPLEGLIAQKGGFAGIAAAEVEKLIYWQLGVKDTVAEKDVAKMIDTNEQNLKEVINLFDFESTPYICHPNPKRIPEYSDYEHLARVKEWKVTED